MLYANLYAHRRNDMRVLCACVHLHMNVSSVVTRIVASEFV